MESSYQRKTNDGERRERLLASKNKQNEEKPKRKRSQVTLDLLNELDS